MSNKLPRRDLLLAWLGGLLAGCLGRSQAHAAPTPPLSHPSSTWSVSDPLVQVTTYVYDASGNFLKRIDPGHTSFTYDGRNT